MLDCVLPYAWPTIVYDCHCCHHSMLLSNSMCTTIACLCVQSELKDTLSVQEGFIFDYQDIVDDRRKLEM